MMAKYYPLVSLMAGSVCKAVQVLLADGQRVSLTPLPPLSKPQYKER